MIRIRFFMESKTYKTQHHSKDPLRVAWFPTIELRHFRFHALRWRTAKMADTKGAFVTTINSYDRPGRRGNGKQYTLPVFFGPPDLGGASFLATLDIEILRLADCLKVQRRSPL